MTDETFGDVGDPFYNALLPVLADADASQLEHVGSVLATVFTLGAEAKRHPRSAATDALESRSLDQLAALARAVQRWSEGAR